MIKITRTKDEFCSCSSCGHDDTADLYDVEIRRSMNVSGAIITLCNDCIDKISIDNYERI